MTRRFSLNFISFQLLISRYINKASMQTLYLRFLCNQFLLLKSLWFCAMSIVQVNMVNVSEKKHSSTCSLPNTSLTFFFTTQSCECRLLFLTLSSWLKLLTARYMGHELCHTPFSSVPLWYVVVIDLFPCIMLLCIENPTVEGYLNCRHAST